jgi:hypothetical protein
MNKIKTLFLTSLTIAILSGISIAFIDTRPHWDDAGISALMILISSFFCGLISPQSTWLIALAVGIWIPLFNIISTHNFGSLLALIPAFIGAFSGYFAKNAYKGIIK